VASDFVNPTQSRFPPWVRYASLLPLYGIGVPLVKLLDAAGWWPQLLGRKLPDAKTVFGDYEPTGHDVFVCSYFKAGTTWGLQIAVQIAHRGSAEFTSINELVPWPDSPRPLARFVIPLDDESPLQQSPTGLRVIKTHYDFDQVPFATEARYIAITRDPKDVCVSGYHFVRSLAFGPLMPSVDNWVRFFLSPKFSEGNWARHLSSYWAVRDRPNVLFLTYEEMKSDVAGTVRRIADFMGVTLSTEEMAEVTRRSGFEYMKQAASKFDPGQMVPWGGSEFMVRRGERGSSSELLTRAQQELIDETCRSELKRLGCDFPYDALYGTREGAVRQTLV
jgi:hypothetical protein